MQVGDEKKVKTIYALLEEDIEQEGSINIEQHIKELAEAEFTKGDYISKVAMKKRLKQW